MRGDQVYDENESLEKRVGMLLKRAYEPVESRPEFREDLLGKLKQRQQVMRQTRSDRRRRNVIQFYGSLAALATAAAIVVSILPHSSTAITPPPPNKSAPTLEPGTAFVEASDETPALESHLVAARPVPAPTASEARTWKPTTIEDETKTIIASMATPVQSVGAAALVDEPSVPLRVMSPARHVVSKSEWHTVAADESVSLGHNECIRSVENTDGEVGIWVGDGSVVGLYPGGELGNRKGDVALCRGEAIVIVHKGAQPLALRVPDYRLQIEPGSRIFLRVVSGPEYAEGGAPAPCVTVLDGAITAKGPHGTGQLRAGSSYRLYSTFINGMPGRTVTDTQRRILPTSGRRPSLASLASTGAAIRGIDRSAVSDQLREPGELESSAGSRDNNELVLRGHHFLRRDGRWVAEGVSAGDQPQVRLAYDSPEFYEFLRDNQWLKYYIYHLGPSFVLEHDGLLVEMVANTRD